MRNAIAIAKKELNIYFATPIAYVMFTLFVVIGSYFFLRLLASYEQASLMYMRFQNPEAMSRLNFQDAIFRALFGNMGVILIFVVPFLTMRLVAEEKRQKTIELLYSTPITPGEVVWGKYVAALAVLVCTLALTLIYPALVQLVARDPRGVDWRSIFLGYAGLFLLGAAYMALGLFISSLTESQVVAALITFVVLLMTWIIGWTAAETEGATRELVTYLDSLGTQLTGRGTFYGVVSAATAVLVVAVLVGVNYIAVKKPHTWDLTKEKIFTLSDQTVSVLKGLKGDVRVVAFYAPNEPEYTELDQRLRQYRQRTDKLHVELLDPAKHVKEVKEFNISQSGPRVIVKAGGKESRAKDTSEEALTNAIAEVTRGATKKIYFSKGHGEHAIGDATERGMKLFVDNLKSEGYQVEEIELAATKT